MEVPGVTPEKGLTRAIRAFLRTESGGTMVLLAATLIALVWANSPFADTYEALWQTPFALRLGDLEFDLDLRHWVNDGLMALFFFVIGMEVSREFSVGEMRDRRRALPPALAAVGGLIFPIGLYLAFNPGGPTAVGWGIPMATDTAFVLGVLVLVGPRCPDPLRVFMLTLSVVDDVGAIAVIAVAYTRHIGWTAAGIALCLFALLLLVRRFGEWRSSVYLLLGLAMWGATVESGIHPTVIGLTLGVLVQVYEPHESHVLRMGELTQMFLRDPTPERGREAVLGLRTAVPPNERLQLLLHPWTSYLIVPLFALANAGVPISAETLSRALVSPVTHGVVVGLVVGKFVGVCVGTWVALRSGMGALPGNLVWGQLAGGAALAGIGFTVSLFIAELAFEREVWKEDAKIGILLGLLIAAVLGRLIFAFAWNRGAACEPPLAVGEDQEEDRPEMLTEPVTGRDHIAGPDTAPVTVVEYGDYECPHCGRLHPITQRLRERFEDDLRFVFRHFPLDEVHPRAVAAALASEAADEYARFWEMHEELFAHQRELDDRSLARHAERIGVPGDAVVGARSRVHLPRVAADIASGRASGVRGTPTLFINGRRYSGPLDEASLSAAIDEALSS
ncbi:Na+/H+ antiporter NhaA [Saccharopolyspora sp. K220]|uniref:Na+/H+ antiporter NhaA n=1 Tax=Saccharopolyspora soli TaxID=2926618 RepID=UPI001F5A4953|nr:Na+/H+ antiporter NhaA [Saccharopolyspora soli]MCI2419317.1 Na+/H+ antiporter NhaA [Saccharopolyspora soli]